MIKKLLQLVIACIKHPLSAYAYKNLWCYLKYGYTIADYTDLDLYLLQLIAEMSSKLVQYEAEVTQLDVLKDDLPDDYLNILALSNISNRLYFATIHDVLTEREKLKYQSEFLRKLRKVFFKLWL